MDLNLFGVFWSTVLLSLRMLTCQRVSVGPPPPRTFEQAASGTRSIRLAGERQGPFILPQTAGSHLDNSRSVYVQMHDSQTEQPQAENVLEPSQVLGKSRHHPWSRMRKLDPISHGEGCAMVDYVWWRHWFEALKYIHHTCTHHTCTHMNTRHTRTFMQLLFTRERISRLLFPLLAD